MVDQKFTSRSGHFVDGFLCAVSFFTRWPVRATDVPLGQSVWAWPVVGGLLGLVVGLICNLFAMLGVPEELLAAIGLALLVVFTGGLHEDGLADTFDGVWGARNREERLRIMKDSHIGTFGTLALILSILLRWGCMTHVFGFGFIVEALLVFGAVSRFAPALAIKFLPAARDDGLGAMVGRVPNGLLLAGGIISSVFVFLLLDAIFVLALLGGFTLVIPTVIIARKAIGGYTGDILGCIQQAMETGCWLGLMILANQA